MLESIALANGTFRESVAERVSKEMWRDSHNDRCVGPLNTFQGLDFLDN
jgi:hypothetical protein